MEKYFVFVRSIDGKEKMIGRIKSLKELEKLIKPYEKDIIEVSAIKPVQLISKKNYAENNTR